MDSRELQTECNPYAIENYFDGELASEEMEALREEIVHSQTYGALKELRDAVRIESQLALEDIDGYALLDAINREIDSHAKASPEPTTASQPKRRTSRQFFQRWAPALVGAALFLLSIPGLVHWIAGANNEAPNPTVVIVDSNGSQHAAQTSVVKFQHEDPKPVPAAEQLTVEEMDTALRVLIQRIETLEEANRNSIESGAMPIGSLPEETGNSL